MLYYKIMLIKQGTIVWQGKIDRGSCPIFVKRIMTTLIKALVLEPQKQECKAFFHLLPFFEITLIRANFLCGTWMYSMCYTLLNTNCCESICTAPINFERGHSEHHSEECPFLYNCVFSLIEVYRNNWWIMRILYYKGCCVSEIAISESNSLFTVVCRKLRNYVLSCLLINSHHPCEPGCVFLYAISPPPKKSKNKYSKYVGECTTG